MGRALIEVVLSRFLTIIIIIIIFLSRFLAKIIIINTYEEGEEGGHVILVHSQEVSLVENLHVDVLKKVGMMVIIIIITIININVITITITRMMITMVLKIQCQLRRVGVRGN